MTYAVRHGIFAADLGGTVVPVRNDRLNTNPNVRAEVLSGNLSPMAVYLAGGAPGGTLVSNAVAAIYDLVGLMGLRISATPLRLYGQKFAAGSGPASGSSHLRYTMAKGCAYPMAIRCNHQSDAEIEIGILGESTDGTTYPLVIADSQALPSAVTTDVRHTLGPITLGGVALAGCTGWDLQFNVQVEADATDSDLYPTTLAVVSINPKLTLTGSNLTWALDAGVPLTGLCCAHADTEIYLRKRSQCSTSKFVDDATAEHIKITLAGLAIPTTIVEGSETAKRTAAVELTTKHDGTNQPITIDTTAALP